MYCLAYIIISLSSYHFNHITKCVIFTFWMMIIIDNVNMMIIIEPAVVWSVLSDYRCFGRDSIHQLVSFYEGALNLTSWYVVFMGCCPATVFMLQIQTVTFQRKTIVHDCDPTLLFCLLFWNLKLTCTHKVFCDLIGPSTVIKPHCTTTSFTYRCWVQGLVHGVWTFRLCILEARPSKIAQFKRSIGVFTFKFI